MGPSGVADSFLSSANILWENRTQCYKPFEKREGREITGSLEIYRNKRKKDKVNVILCVAILESIMLYHMRSGLD